LKGAMGAAEVQIALGYDVLTDPELRAAAKAEMEKQRRGQAYVCPLPTDRTQPFGLDEVPVKQAYEEITSQLDGA
jgi:aminobenzoyl-glutamate utilization protein B